MYSVIDVPSDASELTEQVGSKFKFWYDNQTKMFKLGREGTVENFSEKVAAELSALLDVPHAKYELARWRNKLGTVTENIAPSPGRLSLGNELLVKFTPTYDYTQTYRQRQHTVGRVMAVLGSKNHRPPLSVPALIGGMSATDIFIGYLMLDAWIGNTDRHHENWGFVLLSAGAMHLAPTFDHASSLARELTDAARTERMNTRDQRQSVAAYVKRATSALYRSESEKTPLSTMDAFREAAKWGHAAAAHWLDRLEGVSGADVEAIFANIPPEFASEPARQFARAILRNNRETLLSMRVDLKPQ